MLNLQSLEMTLLLNCEQLRDFQKNVVRFAVWHFLSCSVGACGAFTICTEFGSGPLHPTKSNWEEATTHASPLAKAAS